MKKARAIMFHTLAAAATAMAVNGVAMADDFPTGPLQLVTPYPPGGSTSLHAGLVTTAAEAHFGQPMISVIRPGGGGVIGAMHVLDQRPDGYVMLFGDPNLNSLRPQVEELPFKVDDFVGVARINYSPWVFVTSPDSPFEPTLESMAEYARENPEELVYSSDNVNGPTHIVFELLQYHSDTKMTPVHFGGGGPAVQNLLGGNTMAYAGDPSVVGDHIRAGTLLGVCVSDTQRWDALPDVPTCTETGMNIVFHFWRGVLVHKDTPQERIDFLSEAFRNLTEDEGFQRLIRAINSNIAFLGHEEFEEYLEGEQTELRELYEAIGTE